VPAVTREAAGRSPPHRAPAAAVAERAAASAPRGPMADMPDARVSSLLSGKPLYRMGNGRLVELPEDMTPEQAARLEADAKAAQQKLGKGPAPKPVPDLRKPADKREKKGGPKGKGGGARAGHGGRSAPRTAGVKAQLRSFGGKAAQYLLGKAGPVLSRGIGALQVLSRHEQTHDDAPRKLGQAEMAVVIPASENQSKGNAGQVASVGARPAPPVDPNKGKQKLRDSLTENVPKSIEDVDNFKRDMKAQHMGADVMQVVQGDKNSVVSTYADMERTPPPAPPEHAPEALPPIEGAPNTGALNLGQNAVAPLQPEHTDVSSYTNEADAKLKEEGVTQEQLDMVDSGDLAAANKEKKGMAQMAKSEPQAIRQFSQQQAQKVDTELKHEERQGRAKVAGKRKAGLGGTAQKQKHAKSALEKKRDEVAAKINGIYKAAQDKVKKKLADLDVQSMKRFDDGNAKASRAFEDTVNRELDAFKDDRYSGMFGWARKARDWLLGMDDLPGVKAIFDRNRAIFVATIDRLVADIGADNKRVIQECREELARAKADIKDYVDKLGPALKDIGRKTAGEMNRQLEEMDGFVRKQEEELQQKLADKQQAAIKAIDEKIEKMKDAMSGALAKLGKLLLLAAKKLFTWALQQFGYSLGDIQGIIDKGVAVLKAIFTKPVKFVKNLMSAAILGFKNFGKNFLKHLQDALFEWLTGSLEGVTLPRTWDVQGIVGLALQMIGISYANVRRHMVTVMGETVVLTLEKTFTLVKTLVTQGPMAAWEQLKDLANDMKEAFIQAVKDFIKWKIVEEAIKWVVSIFVPGAGLIKAAIGIYDTIVFFIKKAADIAKMVANFLGSIAEIAAGNISAAADAMEHGLARALSLVITFLARLLHLDAVTAKIRAAIQKIHAKVDDAMLKVAKWIWDKAQKVLGVAKSAVKSGVKKLVEWWKLKRGIEAGGKKITLSTEGTEDEPQVLIEASPKQRWTNYFNRLPKSPDRDKAIALAKKLEERRKPIREPDEAKYKKATAKAAEDMRQTFNELAEQIKILNEGSATPMSVSTFDSVNNLGAGSKAVSTILSTKHPGGSRPGDKPPIWENLAYLGAGKNRKVRAAGYVQGHLLNENLGGPGMRFNLTPLTIAANNAHKDKFESKIKNVVKGGAVLHYSVQAMEPWGESLKLPRLKKLEEAKDKRPKGAPQTAQQTKEDREIESLRALRKLTKGLVCEAYELEPNDAGKWVRKTKQPSFKLIGEPPVSNDPDKGDEPYGY
jgi:hypothetical protein